MQIYKPKDIVWVHDYQLLLVPELLRQRAGAEMYIGLFLHTPFPSSEIVRCLSSESHFSFIDLLDFRDDDVQGGMISNLD